MNALPAKVHSAWCSISNHGPQRVVINSSGEAVSSSRADRIGLVPDIIFIRDDGWSLGAPAALETIAYSIWRKEWAAFARRGDLAPSPITEYQPREHRPDQNTGARIETSTNPDLKGQTDAKSNDNR